jgi:N-acetylmuramoyl-L-alanine amidase
MRAHALTRRSLLAGALGAGTSGLLGRSCALAAFAAQQPRTRVLEHPLGAIRAGVTRVALPAPADLVGVQYGAPRDVRVEISFRAGGRWSAWTAAGAQAHGPDRLTRAHAREAQVGEPVWTGGTGEVAIRCERALSDVRLHAVDVSDGLGARPLALAAAALARVGLRSPAPLALAEPLLVAGAGQPPIIARRAWAHGSARPRVAPAYGAVRLAFVHHTDNPNSYARGEVPAMLRAIYAFHTYVNGWNDIGYNFAIDAFGRIFEARAGGIDEPVIGAHAGGYNYASTGIAVLGTFQGACISRAARVALERLLAWKLSLHGVGALAHTTVTVNPAGAVWSKYPADARVSLATVAGHRDADSTDCPGERLYAQLGHIRAAVHTLAPAPTRATLSLAAPGPAPGAQGAPEAQPTSVTSPVPAGEPAPARPNENEPHVVAGSPALVGTLAIADGTPVAGATVAIQARAVSRRGEVVAEQTLLQVQTDAAGAFAATLAPLPAGSRALSVRALYLGGDLAGATRARATVSAPLALAPTPLSRG